MWSKVCPGPVGFRHLGGGRIEVVCYGQPTPPPDDSLEAALLTAGQDAQAIEFNPGAALQKRILADGFVPNSPEFDITHQSVVYRGQRAENLGSGEVRVYYAAVGDWGNVLYVVRP